MVLHTTLNAIPDFTLGQPAHYESALGLFFVFLLAAVVVAAIVDPRLRNAPCKDLDRISELGIRISDLP